MCCVHSASVLHSHLNQRPLSPLCGAGTMEGGRQADLARDILAAKNVPYVVAAPLLIQDMASWSRDGIAGLQVRHSCCVIHRAWYRPYDHTCLGF